MKRRLASKKTVMITGGHLTPALSVIEQLQIAHPDWDVLFVGRRFALEGYKSESEEYRVVTGLGIPFIPISAGRLKRDWTILTVLSLLKIPVGFVQALFIVGQIKPSAVMSFGGYVALPVVCAAWIMGIPVVTHEQTSHPGLANRMIAKMSRVVCVSFPGQEQLFGKAVTVTGLPLRTSVFSPGVRSPVAGPIDKPVLFITGGNTGSVSINTVVYQALPDLLRDFYIIHQVGRLSISRAKEIVESLDPTLSKRYLPLSYLDAGTYAWVLHKADIVIGRSGANTVMEVAALGKVAIFIPLPWASGNEQHKNAHYLVEHGGALILPQHFLSKKSLYDAVHRVWKDKLSYQKKAKDFAPGIKRDGAVRVLHALEGIIAHAS